jgi:hypothetical protein
MIPTAWLALVALVSAQTPDVANLPEATVTIDAKAGEIIIDVPAIPLPPHTGHHGAGGGGFPPVVKAVMPVGASLYGFRVEVLDDKGNALPSTLIHHFNLIDPANRELFLPISRRIMAVGQETGSQKLPKFFFGVPLAEGDILVASAMLHNPTAVDYPMVTTRLILEYVPEGKLWPFWDGFPFQLDVAFPVGDKSFPLPPGESSFSYEAKPGIAGKIVAIGGHLHDYGTRIELTEVETGRVIWSTEPTLDKDGKVVGVPIGKLYGLFSLGAAIAPEYTYRVTAYYDNPTGQTLAEGGMGVVGGLFVPAKGAVWPTARVTDALYLSDAAHYLRLEKNKTAADREGMESMSHVHPPTKD